MGAPKRFFADINYPSETEVTLSGDEYSHAKTVLRLGVGDEVVLLSGDGRQFSAVVAAAEKKTLTCHIMGELSGGKDPEADIYLLCGVLKGDKTELVIQKATELGVGKIGVFRSGYTTAVIGDNKKERWEKVAREAAKQCLRASVPQIEVFDSFYGALESADGYENKFFFCEFAASSDVSLSDVTGKSFALVVGSEGGFSEEEYRFAKDGHGFFGMTLGKRILRAETAAIAAVTLISYFSGEMS